MAIFNKISSKNTHNSTNGTSRLKDIVYDASVSPMFPDFSYGSNDNLRVRSGQNSFSTLIDLPIPVKPNYGSAEIDSFELGIDIHTLRQGGGGEQGSYQVYYNKTNMGDNEGDMDAPIEDVSFWGSTITDEPCAKCFGV